MPFELRPFEDADTASLLEAFRGRGGACGGILGEDAEAGLAWARANPAGLRTRLLFRDGRLVGHLSAVGHRTWMGDEERDYAELVGGFVDVEGGLGLRRTPLIDLVRSLVRPAGNEAGAFAHYLWPDRIAWGVGQRAFGLEAVRTVVALVQEFGGSGGGGAEGEFPPEVERLAAFDHQARWLWDRCAGAFGASAIRDAAFLNHRFVERPGVSYERLGLRDDDGVLRGYAVLREAPWRDQRALWLCDWLVPPEEPEVGERLFAACGSLARSRGSLVWVAVLPEWSPWFDTFQRLGALARPTEMLLAARPGARRFDSVWMRNHWWVTLADTWAF